MREFDQNEDSISVYFDELKCLSSKLVGNMLTKRNKQEKYMYPRNDLLKYVSCME